LPPVAIGISSGRERREAVELAYELVIRLIGMAERPPVGKTIEHFDQTEALLVEILSGKTRGFAGSVRQILLKGGPIDHLHVDATALRTIGQTRCRPDEPNSTRPRARRG
jgi:hypothetical protein